MDLGVVLLNWNNAPDTLACVEAVGGWRSLSPSIWVVDNASTDGSAKEIARRFPNVHLIRNPENKGFSGGNNAGIERALLSGCQAILLLNNDALLEESSVHLLIAALEAHPELGLVGPVLSESDGKREYLTAGGRDIARHINTRIPADPALVGKDVLAPVDYVPGTAALMRSETLRRTGLFDERYFFSAEIADLCKRAAQNGYRSAIVMNANARHRMERAGEKRSTLYLYYSLRNRLLYIRKFGPAARFVYWSGYYALLALKNLAAGKKSVARAAWLALSDGWSGRFGGQNERVGTS